MKKALVLLSIGSTLATGFTQGTVVFVNTPATLVSAGQAGESSLISGPPGSYYFGLLVATPGTAEPRQFTFPGVYATNSAAAGRIGPGSYVPKVPGWAPGATMSFMVAGWSSSLGHDWDQQWLNGTFGASGFFGLSSIATGIAGGNGGGIPSVPLNLFGGDAIQTGWNLDAVPEPSAAALLAIGAMMLMIYHCWIKKRGTAVP